MSEVWSDLEDLEHDRGEARQPGPGNFKLVSEDHPCRAPWLCDFDHARRCRFCRKKSGLHPETFRAQDTSLLTGGGMPLAREDLAACEWRVQSLLAAKRGVRIG